MTEKIKNTLIGVLQILSTKKKLIMQNTTPGNYGICMRINTDARYINEWDCKKFRESEKKIRSP